MREAREVIAKAMLDLKASGKPDTANAYADAILTALSSAGLAVVPVEPTQAMIDRGTAAIDYDTLPPPDAPPDHDYDDDTGRIYRAMVAAALPPLASGGG